jgi:membrane protease YdiL (CAAX protease family)
MTQKAWYVLGLTFAITWAIEGITLQSLGGFSALNDVGPGAGIVMLIFLGCMYVPTLSVLIVQKGLYGEPLRPLGLSFQPNWWWTGAVLLPIGVAVTSVGVSVLWPDVVLSSGKAFVFDQLEAVSLPADQLAEAKQSVNDGDVMLGPTLAAVLLGVALIAGPTVNALAAFGEEFCWRGFLQKELAPLGFWRSSLLIGVVWGLWHGPLILGGYNYPGMPVMGLLMMTLFTVAWSPVHAYAVVQGGSVIPAAMMHGTINALAGATYVFLEGGTRLEVGLLGAAGLLVVAGVNVGLWWHQQHRSVAFSEKWAAFCQPDPNEAPTRPSSDLGISD